MSKVATSRRLSFLDAAFFVFESAERMANIGPLVILKPPLHHPSGTEFADWLMAEMIKQAPGDPFNMVYRPAGIGGLPRLEIATSIELSRHCHRITVPAPGKFADLIALVCKLHTRRLDLSRPPWEFFFIDGLDNGRVAIYGKVHHGLIDGINLLAALSRNLSASPNATRVRALWAGLHASAPQKAARHAKLTVSAVWQQATQAKHAVQAMAMLFATQALKNIGLAKGAPLPYLNVGRAFSAQPSVARSFGFCVLPLRAVKRLGERHDATVNDVLLTVLDMALIRYLKERISPRQRMLESPLVADIPIALTSGSEAGRNRIAVIPVPLGDPRDNPARRLRHITQHLGEVKDQVRNQPAAALMLHTTLVHAIPALAEVVGIKGWPRLANAVISNTFGLTRRTYIGGGEIELALPVSVLVPGESLNITAATCHRQLQIAFLGMAEAMPDIATLAGYTVDAFAELGAYLGRQDSSTTG